MLAHASFEEEDTVSVQTFLLWAEHNFGVVDLALHGKNMPGIR